MSLIVDGINIMANDNLLETVTFQVDYRHAMYSRLEAGLEYKPGLDLQDLTNAKVNQCESISNRSLVSNKSLV